MQLSQDALVLPPEERVALAYRLLVSVEPSPEPGAEAAWDAETHASTLEMLNRRQLQKFSIACIKLRRGRERSSGVPARSSC